MKQQEKKTDPGRRASIFRFQRLLRVLLVIALLGGVMGTIVLFVINAVVMAPGRKPF